MHTPCKKPGIQGEPHSIINISNHYIQKFADRTTVMPNGCHFLKGNTQNNGYINWWYRYQDADGTTRVRYISAHRFGALLSGKFGEAEVNENCVLHDCDQLYAKDDISYRQCVNPDHLWIGNPRDNILDCIAKGRYTQPIARLGTDNYNSKLTEAQAKYIIAHHYIITQKQLAVNCGVHNSTVEAIHSGKTWKHLPR